MGVLQRFERRLEGLVSGVFTRVFKGQVEPVEVAAQLQRETDDNRTVVTEGRILVPNDFVVQLGSTDYQRLSPYAEPLGAELADMVSEHAAEQGYSFVGPVRVNLELADELGTGRFLVRSGVAAAGADRPSVAAPSPNRNWTAPPPPSRPDWANPGHSAKASGDPGRRAGPRLEFTRGTGPTQSLTLTRGVTTVGRGAECDLRLEDTGVSRRHAEFRLDHDSVTVADLGSTNGTSVNGTAIGSQQLVDGDRLVVGTTRLVFRSAEP
ncbi:MAG: FhaA domain-containing protein [Mycobacteriales bacterium]